MVIISCRSTLKKKSIYEFPIKGIRYLTTYPAKFKTVERTLDKFEFGIKGVEPVVISAASENPFVCDEFTFGISNGSAKTIAKSTGTKNLIILDYSIDVYNIMETHYKVCNHKYGLSRAFDEYAFEYYLPNIEHIKSLDELMNMSSYEIFDTFENYEEVTAVRGR